MPPPRNTENEKEEMVEINLTKRSPSISLSNKEAKSNLESSKSLAVGDVDPFANSSSENDIKWKNLSWWQCSAIMLVRSFELH